MTYLHAAAKCVAILQLVALNFYLTSFIVAMILERLQVVFGAIRVARGERQIRTQPSQSANVTI